MTPAVLLAGSLCWPNLARLAIAFRQAGFHVDAVAPKGHPVHLMRSPRRTFVYDSYRATTSLRKAIYEAQPDIVVPCDDLIVRRLYRLCETAQKGGRGNEWAKIAALVESSLGPPQSFGMLRERGQLSELCRLAGVHAAETGAIGSFRQLRNWVQTHSLPAVLKLDGRYGGEDVVIVKADNSLSRAFVSMRVRQLGLKRLKHALLNVDARIFLNHVLSGGHGLSVQSFVVGQPANCAVAAWRGKVLAAVAVKTVRAVSPIGASTVVRVVQGNAMKETAQGIVRHLGLSGFCGFDFLIGESETPLLIEINPRATQINHLRLRCGPDLPTALRLALEGKAEATPFAPVVETDVALFPQEWERDANSPYVAAGYDDVPYEEPELLNHFGFAPPKSLESTFAA